MGVGSLTGLAIVGGFFAMIALALWIALRASREAGRSDLEARNAERALRDRERLDEVLATRIGRRRVLLEWLKRREAERSRKP